MLTSCTLLLSIAVAADMQGLVTLGGDDTTTGRNYLPQTEELACWTKNVHVLVSLCTIMFHLVCACVRGGGGVCRMHTLNCMGACPYFSYRNFTGVPAPIASVLPWFLCYSGCVHVCSTSGAYVHEWCMCVF